MNTFFENRAIKGDIKVNINHKHIFPSHFHLDLEIFILLKGKFNITIGEKEYTLTDGHIAVIDSYDVHSYDKDLQPANKESLVAIIPYRHLERFNTLRKFFKIKSPVFYAPQLANDLFNIASSYMSNGASDSVKESATDLFLSLLSNNLQFTNEKSSEDSVLIRNILAFVQENYRKKISLETVSKHLGYTSAHVSRAFHKYIKISLPTYINQLRITYIENALELNSKLKITHLIYEAGFNSQQTYYRQKQLLKI